MSKSYTKNRLVFGVGINDADYVTQKTGSGVGKGGKVKRTTLWKCPYYKTWVSMLKRCYYNAVKDKAYKEQGVLVVKEWHTFSKFKAWMETQYWDGMVLDKDILSIGCKVYGPDTCVFVPAHINSLFNIKAPNRGKYPLGVAFKDKTPDMVNPLKKCFWSYITTDDCKQISLGVYTNPEDAHKAWQSGKITRLHEILQKYRNQEYYDARVGNFILKVADKIGLDLSLGLETKELI